MFLGKLAFVSLHNSILVHGANNKINSVVGYQIRKSIDAGSPVSIDEECVHVTTQGWLAS